jgi:transposase
MIEADKRKAIYLLHQEEMSIREIARRLGVSRNAVRRAIEQKGETVHTTRQDKQQIDPDLLRRLYQECDGRVQRMHEKLLEEEHIQVSYPTLTRMVRELGLGTPPQTRCQQVPDEPGLEMQHDTTVYQIPLAGQPVKLIASLLYLRYSKRRYLKFYRTFDRFQMKCFLRANALSTTPTWLASEESAKPPSWCRRWPPSPNSTDSSSAATSASILIEKLGKNEVFGQLN